MQTAVFNMTLDIDDALSQADMYLRQGESGRKISVQLTESGKPFRPGGFDAVFAGTRPDGQVFFNECTIEDGRISCDISAQISTVAGVHKAEIRLYADNVLIASPAFSIFVEECAMAEGTLAERTEVTELTRLIGQVRQSIAEHNTFALSEAELSYFEDGGEAAVDMEVEEGEDRRTIRFSFSNLKGEQGVQGEQGIQGEKGDKGDKGDPGRDGTDLKSYVTPTISGAVASLDDGAEDIPVKSLVVDIEPVQNLNGYDAPWPPGGGKNLFVPRSSLTVNGVSITSNGDGSYILNGTASASNSFRINEPTILPAGEYTITVTGLSGVGNLIDRLYITANDTVIVRDIYSGTPRTFSLSEESSVIVSMVLNVGTSYSNKLVEIQIEAGETATAYEPYSNICPISGWTGVNVLTHGTNLWNEEWELGGIVYSTGQLYNATGQIRAASFSPCAGGVSYFLIRQASAVHWYDSSYTFIKSSDPGVVTSPDKAAFFKISFVADYGVSYLNNAGLNYPATATGYVPFVGNNAYNISFPTEAGTVYGGTLDVTTGLLTVDARVVQIKDLTLEMANAGGRGVLRASGSSGYASSHNGPNVCECFAYSTLSISTGPENSWFLSYYWDSNLRVAFYAPEYETVGDFKAAFGEYSLAIAQNPVTYQLTPQEVNTLLGVNNIYADTGDSSVTYRADPTLIYNKLTAAIISSGGTV